MHAQFAICSLRLTDIVTTKSGDTLLNSHYTFDNVGNILSVQDNARGETTNYGYDDLNRLLSASVTTGGNQYSRSWTYDTIGNISTRVEQGATTTYQYNDATSKHAVTHLNNVLKYQYDANGNMISRDGDTLAYDVENRLTNVTKAGVTTSFVYNADGARVKRTVSNAGTTYYIGNYYEVWVPNSGTTTFNKYYYFNAQRVAAKIGADLFYLQGDHLGSSSVVMTSASTSFYSRQTYFPYGAQRTTEGSALPTDYTFTGQKADDSTGLMFYGARYYDTSLGRFTQPDTIVPSPMDPQSLNRYSYVRNNPVRYVDPTGHAETCEESCGQEGTGDPSESSGENNACAANDADCDGVPDDEQTDTPADTGTNQYPNGKECWPHCNDDNKREPGFCADFGMDCSATAKNLSAISEVLDRTALITDTVGEGMALGGALIGAALCTESGPGLLGCAAGGYEAGNALAQSSTNLVGNVLSVQSTVMTIAADILTGESRFDNGNAVIGQNTANSTIMTALGFIPDTTVDVSAAFIQYAVNDRHEIPRSALPGPLQLLVVEGPVVIPLPH